MTYFLDLRADSVGGIPAGEVIPKKDSAIIDVQEIVKAAKGKNILFATHGFNVDRQQGMTSLGSWERFFAKDRFLFVGVLWPGDSRWLPVIDYPFEGDEAMVSGKLLGPYLDTWFENVPGLSFVSHSLGARMVLETVRNMRRRVRHVVLMAGAIDDNCLVQEYADVAAKAESLSVLASESDTVLSLAFPLGNFLGGLVSQGHPYWHAALGRQGPDSPFPANLRPGWQLPDRWDYGHGDYLPGSPVAAPPFSLPVDVPTFHTMPPAKFTGWKPDWTAGFVSTRVSE